MTFPPRPIDRHFLLTVAMLTAASLCGIALPGCQTTKGPSTPVTTTTRVPRNATVTDQPLGGNGTINLSANGKTTIPIDKALPPAACEANLQAICGALLNYYLAHRELPPRLEDLQDFADPGETLEFTCPATHQPYGYAPLGLINAATGKRIVVFDAAPAHDPPPGHGTAKARNCVFVNLPGPGKPLTAEVRSVQEPIFNTYVPAGQ